MDPMWWRHGHLPLTGEVGHQLCGEGVGEQDVESHGTGYAEG